LLMANLQACLRGQAMINRSVKDTVTKINFMLSRSTDMGKFITLVYGILNTKNKTLTYTNAGHNYPFLLDKDGNVKTLESGGTVLGAFENFGYEEETLQLNPGDFLLMYTDGITEAMNDKGDMFEEERLLKIIKENKHLSTQELSQKIVDSVLSFQGSTPQSDDLTLVLLKV